MMFALAKLYKTSLFQAMSNNKFEISNGNLLIFQQSRLIDNIEKAKSEKIMNEITLNWSNFLMEAEEFLQLSKSLNDSWELVQKDKREGNTYLCYKKKLRAQISTNTDCSLLEEENLMHTSNSPSVDIAEQTSEEKYAEVLLMEYHIVFSVSYQVPVLYLRIQRSDGSLLEMEQIWEIFGTSNDDQCKSRADMLTVLTQMEHPVLFKPFYAIHPCRTAELLAQTPKSRNRVLTFISVMGPYMKLNLDNQYGLLIR